MKTVRKIFGVCFAIFGAAISILFALIFAVELYDLWRFGYSFGEIWIFIVLFLVGVSFVLLGVYLLRKPPLKKDGKEKNAPVSIETPEYKTYKSSPKEQLKIFCFMVVFPIVLTLLLMVVSNLNSLDRVLKIIKPVLFIVLTASTLSASIISFITYRIRVEIGSFGIRFYRGRRMYAAYPLDSGFHISDAADGWQSIFATYAISVGHEDEKKKRQPFLCFSRQDFSAAWGELRSLLDEKQAEKEQYQNVQSFTIPKTDIKAAMRQGIPQRFSVFLVLGELAVVFFTGLVYLPNKAVMSGKIIYIGMIAFALIAGIAAFIAALKNKRLSGLIPENISFCDGWLRLGDRLYYASQLLKFEFTPGTYRPQNIGRPFYRYLIVSTQRETDVYFLGHKATVQNQVYQDYPLLIYALCDWCESQEVPYCAVADPCLEVK